jgi:hypothetical protein
MQLEAILTTAGRTIILTTITLMDRVRMVTHTMGTGQMLIRTTATVIRTMLTAMIRTVIGTMVTHARLVVQTTRLPLSITDHATTTGGD